MDKLIISYLETVNAKFNNRFKYPYIEEEYFKKDEKGKCILTTICPDHGEFKIDKDVHKYSSYGCAECAKVEKQIIKNKKNKQDFIDRIMNDEFKSKLQYPYIEEEYETLKSIITVVCPIHGEFKSGGENILNSKHLCRDCHFENLSKMKTKSYDDFKHLETHYTDLYFNWDTFESSDTPMEVHCKIHDEKIMIHPWRLYSEKKGYTDVRCCPHCLSEHKKQLAANLNKDLMMSLKSRFDLEYSNLYEIITPIDEILNFGSKHSTIDFKCIKCEKSFSETLPRVVKGFGCPICNTGLASVEEKDLKDFIAMIYNSNNILTNDRKILEGKEIDIVLESHKLGIEYDGIYWHSCKDVEEIKLNKDYHLFKTELAESKDYHLLHIFSDEWIDKNKQNIWKSLIRNKVNQHHHKIYARNCIVKEIDSKTFKEFCEANHLQGFAASKIRLGAFHNNELVSIMSFSSSRFNKNYEYELIRFCNKLDHLVVGIASKLLKHFERNYEPKSIISYANRRWSQGNLYEKLGFELVDKTEPGYFYTNGQSVHSRQIFQKHKLREYYEKNLYNIKQYSDNLNEYENMFNNKYTVLFDCGNLVFKKEFNA